MSFFFPALILAVFLAYALRWRSPVSVLKAMAARPLDRTPVWLNLRARMEKEAHRQRVPLPVIWILPEFSPNALLMRSGRRLHVALTEGAVRALGGEELDSLLALCLAHGYQRGKRLQTRASIWLFPVARFFQGHSASLQLLLFPFASLVLRLFARPHRSFQGDARAARYSGGLLIAASLQKLSVLGAKIPVRNWNFALDGLFLISPLALEQSPWTLFPSQPSIEERRRRILGGIACESAPSLT